MAIYDDDNPRPEEPETTARWSYDIGAKWIAVKEIAGAFSVQVRTA